MSPKIDAITNDSKQASTVASINSRSNYANRRYSQYRRYYSDITIEEDTVPDEEIIEDLDIQVQGMKIINDDLAEPKAPPSVTSKVGSIPKDCSICKKETDVNFYIDTWFCRQCFNILEDLKKK